MGKSLRAGMMTLLLTVLCVGSAWAGLTLYENQKLDLRIGVTDATAWVGQDVKNNETVGGLKTSIVKKGLPLNMSINLDAGIIGTELDTASGIDGIVGLSVTLPEPKEWKGKVWIDVGLAYSPDWLTGPERIIAYGGIKLTY